MEVTKKEIETYMRAHENDFQQENARDLQFVFFEQKPSAEDEKAIEEEVRKLMGNTIEFNETDKINDTIAGFATTADVAEFLDRKSDIKFDTIYRSYNDLPSKFADSLMALQVAELYGPYRDGNYFKVARMMKRKPSGSVKASHILIAYEGAERANPAVTRTKEEAETLAKELLVDAKKADAEFTQLARDNSDGPSAPQGGDLGYFEEGVMTPKFNDFAFGNPVGHIGLVETEFGFHIVKIDDKRDIVQIAYLAREVEPSEETINTLFTDATKFEMAVSAKDADFSAIADESEYIARPVNKVKAMDENLPGLGAQRTIVNWAFAKETELGDIRRFDLPTGHAVVQVTGRYKEGLMSVEDGSATALPILRKDKKAEQIMSDNAGKSFEDFASTNNVSQSNATALSIKSPTLPGAGREPMVVGAAHAMAEGATSQLIKGETGVFMVKVTQKTPAKELDNYSTFAGSLGASNGARANTEVYNALKEAAEIEDNRSTFY
jgi:peptidyl-prolyl cis-trans isomerase D